MHCSHIASSRAIPKQPWPPQRAGRGVLQRLRRAAFHLLDQIAVAVVARGQRLRCRASTCLTRLPPPAGVIKRIIPPSPLSPGPLYPFVSCVIRTNHAPPLPTENFLGQPRRQIVSRLSLQHRRICTRQSQKCRRLQQQSAKPWRPESIYEHSRSFSTISSPNHVLHMSLLDLPLTLRLQQIPSDCTQGAAPWIGKRQEITTNIYAKLAPLPAG